MEVPTGVPQAKFTKEQQLIYYFDKIYSDVNKRLTELGAHIDHGDYFDRFVTDSIEYGDVGIIKYLVEQGMDINRLNNWIFKHACYNGKLNIVQFCVKQGIDVNVENGQGLINAASKNHLKVVEYLILMKVDVNAQESYALRKACSQDHLDIVKCLWYNGANVNAFNGEPLHNASYWGHLEVVKFLVENGAEITEKIINNARRNVSDYLLLHKNRLDVEKICSQLGEVLCLACRKDNYDLIKYLLEDMDIRIDKVKLNEAFIRACSEGYLNIVKLLVEYGADIHDEDDEGLYLACSNGNCDVVKYLIEKCNMIPRDYYLLEASDQGRLEVVKYLVLECNMDIHAEDDCILRAASKANNPEVVKFLVKSGANIHVMDDIPLKWAKYFNDKDLMDFLIERGANEDVIDFGMGSDIWPFDDLFSKTEIGKTCAKLTIKYT